MESLDDLVIYQVLAASKWDSRFFLSGALKNVCLLS